MPRHKALPEQLPPDAHGSEADAARAVLSSPRSTTRHARKRGSTLAIVLGSAVIVMVIGLSALLSAQIQNRMARDSGDLTQARLNATSAIQIGVDRIDADSNWRTTFAAGTILTSTTAGMGTFSLTVADPVDSLLANNDTDDILLTGIGLKGNARYDLQVTLHSVPIPVGALETTMHAGNDTIFNSAALTSDQTISANGSVNENFSLIDADVEAVGSVTGTYLGNTKTGVKPRSLPDPVTVFDDYLANGTTISAGALPTGVLGERLIENTLLSPASNPWGLPNPQGIYVVNLGGQDFTLRNSRILGTLVLLDGATVRVEAGLLMEPAVSNYPVLMVRGALSLRHSASSPLNEALLGAGGTNLNPPGSPYQGATNTAAVDIYPSKIKGLVYASSDVSIEVGDPDITGVLISGVTINCTTSVKLSYSGEFYQNPPPGFFDNEMIITSGSFRQKVN